MVQSGGGEALVEHAQTKGLDPALVNGVMGIIRSVRGEELSSDNVEISQVCWWWRGQ